MRILGVTGSAGVGKDTLADYLCAKYGFVRVALADPMKRIAKDVYGFSDEQLWGPSQERNKPDFRYRRAPETISEKYPDQYLSPRMALQVMGTEFGRTCCLDTWVLKTINIATKLLHGSYDYTKEGGITPLIFTTGSIYRGVVVPDCRFLNEINAIHAAGGQVVRLKRDLHRDPGSVGVPKHLSEMEQLAIPDDNFDLVIDCEEGVRAFHAQLDRVLPLLGIYKE